MATEIDDCVAYMLKNVSGLYSDQIKINEKKRHKTTCIIIQQILFIYNVFILFFIK